MKRAFIFAVCCSLFLAMPAPASACAILMELPWLCGNASAPANSAPTVPQCHHTSTAPEESLAVQAAPSNCCQLAGAPQPEAEQTTAKAKPKPQAIAAKLEIPVASQALKLRAIHTAELVDTQPPDQQALLCVFLA